MAGLARIAKAYGEIFIQGERYVWDYVADKAVPASEMPEGSDRWKASEAKRWHDARERMLAHLNGTAIQPDEATPE